MGSEMCIRDRFIVHEENIFVSKDGPVLLTKRATKELPLIS